MEILNIENLTFTYPSCKSPAIENVSFALNRGDFTVIAGNTGSGKSTLLRLLKPQLTPKGEKKGKILYKGCSISELSPNVSASSIGFVMQRPEHQVVTDKVWHELAFGLENMNVSQNEIARRISEMASYFGIEEWYEKSVSQLSGGQKQLLNLAAVMVMNPDVLILDEPTAQLDPIAAADFLGTLKKLNDELSLTVIIVEHRLEELIPICDKLVILQNGCIVSNGSPKEVISGLDKNSTLLSSMPTAARLFHRLSNVGECPLTVKEGRHYVEKNYANSITALPKKPYRHSDNVVLEFSEVYFRYEKEASDVLKGLSFKVYENEFFCILGGNGSGKTTALLTAAGLYTPYSGRIRIFGKKIKEYKNQSLYNCCLTLLPQDVQTLFLRNTVKEELDDAKVSELSLSFDLSHLYEKHPYDLSGGEQQLLALAKALATKPKLLLLDEPTKGLDTQKKQEIADILRNLCNNGVTVVAVTHDVEFAAAYSDRCAMFFGGNVVSEGTPSEFFSKNNFYTTAACRMVKGYYDGAVSVEDVAQLCERNRSAGGVT